MIFKNIFNFKSCETLLDLKTFSMSKPRFFSSTMVITSHDVHKVIIKLWCAYIFQHAFPWTLKFLKACSSKSKDKSRAKRILEKTIDEHYTMIIV